MDQKKSKNPSPRIKVIQKIYNFLMNPNSEISFPKNQYKKFIKDVVFGTIERNELILAEIKKYLESDINLENHDKVFLIILKSAIYELLYKPSTSSKIIIKEYLDASNLFLNESQTKYLNALLDNAAKKLRSSNAWIWHN